MTSSLEPTPPDACLPQGRVLRRAVLLLLALASLAGLGVVAWRLRQPGPAPDETSRPGADLPPDPRLSYSGPFENVHPSVGYVGDATCAACHVEIAETYARHPMGRSTVPVREVAGKLPIDKAHNNPFDALGVRLWVERRGDRLWHNHAQIDDGRPLWEVRQEVHYVVGSGTRGYSYLAEIDGYVYQTAISWFSHKNGWDLSPGFPRVGMPGRPIHTSCLHCHANRVKEVPGYLRRFEPGVFDGYSIGCERCHGPGQKHVEFREAGGWPEGEFDRTIVNPAHLPWRLRENVCEQCHISGEARILRRGRGWFDYRPGLELADFLAIYVKDPRLPGAHKAVSQVEQMRKSKCFQRSGGKKKLGCISCHDPHEKEEPARAAEYYRKRCLACHQEKSCSLPPVERRRQSPGDACAACHMPKAPPTDIAHVALTDHSIVRPGRDVPAGLPLSPGVLPVVHLHRDRIDEHDPERRRDLGVALMRLMGLNRIPPMSADAVLRTSFALEESLRRGPTDPDGWQAWGNVLVREQRYEEAVAAFERALAQGGKNEEVLRRLANLEMDRGRSEQAVGYFKRVEEVNPHDPQTRRALGRLLAQRGDWAGAGEQARAWLKLEPGSPSARQWWVLSLLEQGRRDEARREFELLRRLKPPNLGELETWFRRRGG